MSGVEKAAMVTTVVVAVRVRILHAMSMTVLTHALVDIMAMTLGSVLVTTCSLSVIPSSMSILLTMTSSVPLVMTITSLT